LIKTLPQEEDAIMAKEGFEGKIHAILGAVGVCTRSIIRDYSDHNRYKLICIIFGPQME